MHFYRNGHLSLAPPGDVTNCENARFSTLRVVLLSVAYYSC
jgi:hypothetical protein